MVEINLTIVIQVVTFLILVAVLNRLLLRPISRTMEERRQRIASWEQRTKDLQAAMDAKLRAYEEQLKEAKRVAQERQKQITEETKQEEQETLGAASREASEILSTTQQKLREETDQLRTELRQQAGELSEMVTEKVLGRKPS